MKKNFFLLLRIIIIVTIFWILSKKVAANKVLSSIASFGVLNFAVMVGLILIGQVTSILKFGLIMKSFSVKTWVLENTTIYLEAMFYNNLFFSTIGGDSFRAMTYISKYKKKGAVLASIFWERAFGFLAMFIAGTLSFAISPVQTIGSHFIFPLAYFLIAILFIIMTLLLSGRRLPLINLLSSKVPILEKMVNKLISHSSEIGSRKGAAFGSLGYSLVFVTICILSFAYALTVTTNGAIPLNKIFLFSPIILLISAIPITITGLGLREWGMLYFFSIMHRYASKEEVMAASLIWFLSVFSLSIFGGIIHLFKTLFTGRTKG